MKKTALITGASSGIGKEFAKYHASKGGDLIITARREGALSELKAELEAQHGVTVHVIALDLAASDGARNLIDEIQSRDLTVDILINNAGFGGHGMHINRSWASEAAMIDLNVKALAELSHAFGMQMIENGGGKILNVASTAAMIPGPLQAVYFASKAFVMSYSQALDEEMRDKGVTVTSLNPGLVLTEFVATANLGNTGLSKQKGASAASVAKIGYDGMLKGKLVVINEPRLAFMLNWITPLLPRRIVLRLIKGMQSKPA
ncbi:SDR family oxidoreductase [Cognatishimia sp. 1_MG-2023]|uniref:SDR family NAD(P)-dependent oxidoreductase n=1 Tax=Cognatishimia sp. 1_MG-2023 TaxID=3062642 RepID=UPI0026E30454|nr:SDR family oxidoreductase [Cognatishimia sp. 1_MG-2023]MDO6725598.1 SDR family oxidoreductase [Cognatishimia sp. 1_MG-2023]